MLYREGEALFPTGISAFSPWGDLLMVKRMEPVDLFAVNLESPFGLAEEGDAPNISDMNLCAEDAAVAVLQQAGIGLVTNANNHAADCGFSGLLHTKDVLEEVGIFIQGSYSPTQFINSGGQVLAVLSLDDYSGGYDAEAVKNALKTARESSDLVLVSVHWGQEYQAGPTLHQQELAQELVDAGADVIWGHHPHVLQRMEWLRSSVDGHEGLVMYSLGNALSDQWMLPDALRTAVIRIEFSDHKVEEILVVPLEMDTTSNGLELRQSAEELDWFNQRLGLNELKNRGVTIRLFVMKDNK